MPYHTSLTYEIPGTPQGNEASGLTQTISLLHGRTRTISQPLRHTHTHRPIVAIDSVRSKLPRLYVRVRPVARLLWHEASSAYIGKNLLHWASYVKVGDRRSLLFHAPRSPNLGVGSRSFPELRSHGRLRGARERRSKSGHFTNELKMKIKHDTMTTFIGVLYTW